MEGVGPNEEEEEAGGFEEEKTDVEEVKNGGCPSGYQVKFSNCE